jgi:hypothetical protein
VDYFLVDYCLVSVECLVGIHLVCHEELVRYSLLTICSFHICFIKVILTNFVP